MTPISHSKFPYDPKVTIHLIREELKSRKFFEGLRRLGLDDDFHQTDLLELIMTGVELVPELQEHYNFCHALLKRHSRRVIKDPGELLDEARRVYDVLVRYAMIQRQTTEAALPSRYVV